MSNCDETTCESCPVSTSSCLSCAMNYYVNSTGNCVVCPGAPQCTGCSSNNPDTCTGCQTGFFLNNGACTPCPSWCATCDSETVCTALPSGTFGYTLVQVNASYTAIAQCDYGCYSCSSADPSFCNTCVPAGFYLSVSTASANTRARSICLPCTISSNCKTCSTSSPSTCTSCFPGDYLAANNTCIVCDSPCTTCQQTNSSFCLSCPSGYTLSSGTCSEIENTNSSAACNENCAQCSTTGSTSTCQVCTDNYVLNSGKCTPCPEGCQICSPNDFSLCLTCSTGNYLNSTGSCVACSSKCNSCTDMGCMSCMYGYKLTSDFTCVQDCTKPCATCASNSPSTCESCLYGYVLNSSSSSCSVNVTTCNDNKDCDYCAFGYVLTSSSTATVRQVTCEQCNSNSNCQRCTSTNVAQCTSCYGGNYLNSNSVCVSCPDGCLECTSQADCFACDTGYVPQTTQTVFATNGLSLSPMTCVACESPCATCNGNPKSCLSCVSGYTFKGAKCVTNFNFQVAVVFSVTAAVFNTNYLDFLINVADTLGVSLRDITIISIVYGSVNLDFQVSTTNSAGSNGAVSQENSLKNLIQSGSTTNGMSVSSSSVTTNGGSNNNGDDDDSGLSKTTIIILAVCIPVGVLLIVGIIVIIYCVHKKRKEQEASMEWNTATQNTTGRNIELMGREKKAYL